MAINRSKALSIYQTEAKRLEEDGQELSRASTKKQKESSKTLKDKKDDSVEFIQTQNEALPPAKPDFSIKEESIFDLDAPRVPLKEPIVCEHVENAYESVMIFQLRRMIRLNAGPFAVMLKILIQGDPKRKYE